LLERFPENQGCFAAMPGSIGEKQREL